MRPPLFLFCSLLFAGGCLKTDLEPLEFIEVHTDSLAVSALGQLELNGRVLGLTATPNVTACGFLWSMSATAISAALPAGQEIAATPPTGNAPFRAPFALPSFQERVYFRAYARLEQNGSARTVYGAVRSFLLGEVVASLAVDSAAVKNNTVAVQGILFNLGTLGLTAEAYGHVYSSTDPDPRLTDIGVSSDSTYFTLANDDNFVFTSRLDSLAFNTRYFIRAYVTSGGQTFYSAVDTFEVLDGWEKIAPFQPYQNGSAAVLGNLVYFGFGCGDAGGCSAAELTNELWAFDANGNNGMGMWTLHPPLPASMAKFENTTLFAIGTTVYALGGNQNNLIHKAFWRYEPDLNGGQWTDMNSSNPPKLSGAVALVFGARAYVGTGLTTDAGGNVAPTNRFWEFDQFSNTWREVAPLPYQAAPGAPIETDRPRADASAFVLFNGRGYVGGGILDPVLLRDWWEYTPPPSIAGTQDPGQWASVGFFPGPARQGAVAFSGGDYGYYGCGLNQPDEIGALADWWAFNSLTKTWEPRTPFQGGPRRNMFGFSINDRGYAGGGVELKVTAGGYVGQPVLRGDVWRYVPRK